MAYDEALAGRVRAIVEQLGPFEERKMFGGLCFMRRDRMSCGVLHDDLVVKLGPDRAADAADRPHVRPFDFTGRPMAGMFYVEPEATRDDAALRGWIESAIAFADSQPPKEPKRGRPKRRAATGGA